jgi:hypothetical protein
VIVNGSSTPDNVTPDALAGAAPAEQNSQRRYAWFTESFVLKYAFRALLVGTVIFLALDFKDIYEEANAPLPGKVTERRPITMEPPKRQDHLRPYLPLTNPVRRKGAGPKMPGYTKPPKDEITGERMLFLRGPKGAVSAIGRIEVGTAEDLAQFIKGQAGEIKTLHLHSPGGSVEDALQMSKLLRSEGIDTVVPDNGYCASSCPIVFSGGKTRLAGKRAWIGVHQVFTATATPGSLNDGMAQGQTVSALVQDHLSAMGVDLRVWVKAMQTPSEKLYIFTADELTEFKLATRIK